MMRAIAFAFVLLVAGAGCMPEVRAVRCVVRIYRPDGTLHREYHGTFRSFDGTLPVVHNGRGGAAWVYLDGRVIDAAVGWQIEVDRAAEGNP